MSTTALPRCLKPSPASPGSTRGRLCSVRRGRGPRCRFRCRRTVAAARQLTEPSHVLQRRSRFSPVPPCIQSGFVTRQHISIRDDDRSSRRPARGFSLPGGDLKPSGSPFAKSTPAADGQGRSAVGRGGAKHWRQAPKPAASRRGGRSVAPAGTASGGCFLFRATGRESRTALRILPPVERVQKPVGCLFRAAVIGWGTQPGGPGRFAQGGIPWTAEKWAAASRG